MLPLVSLSHWNQSCKLVLFTFRNGKKSLFKDRTSETGREYTKKMWNFTILLGKLALWFQSLEFNSRRLRNSLNTKFRKHEELGQSSISFEVWNQYKKIFQSSQIIRKFVESFCIKSMILNGKVRSFRVSMLQNLENFSKKCNLKFSPFQARNNMIFAQHFGCSLQFLLKPQEKSK